MEFHRCNRECRRHGCAEVRTAKVTKTDARTAASIKAASNVPLFYLDQNQSEATTYQVTRDQADKMKAAGRGKYINHSKAFQLYESAPAPRLRYVCSESPDSTASISLSEMQAFAGVPSDTPGSYLPRHLVVRARQKIHAIGRRLAGTFDTKAPLAFGAWSWPVYRADLSNTYEPQMEA
jgi:hypothetical protein